MNTNSSAPSPPQTDPWDAELARLRGRFPKANDSVLICIHALQQERDVALDDLKARAAMHGIRVTGASVNAARRALGLAPPVGPRRRSVHDSDADEEAPVPVAAEERAPARRRRVAAGSRADNLEQVLRDFVAHADEERERLRAAIRRVIEVVDDALA